MQETYLLAFRALRTLEDVNGFRQWLLAIAHNVLIDDTRRSARQKRASGTADLHLAQLPSSEPAPDETAARNELRQQVLGVLRSLPVVYQLPLMLRYITGADYDTISVQLGLTNGSLRGLLHRGLKLFRDRLPADLAAEFRG